MPSPIIVFVILTLTLASAWGWGNSGGYWLHARGSTIGPIWIGLAIVASISLILHFFVPLSLEISLLLLVLGLFQMLFYVINSVRARKFQWEWPAVAVALVAVAIVSMVSVGNYRLYDTGLYHVQAVQWYSNYPVVPGLANLHGRFGYNSSLMVLGSLFQSFPGGATHYAVSIWVSAALIESLSAFQRMWIAYRSHKPSRFGDIGWVLVLLPMALMTRENQYPSLSTDIPPLLVSFTLLLVVLRAVRGEKITSADLASSTIVAAFLITQKLSYAVFAAACLLLVMYFAFRRIPDAKRVALQWTPSILFSVGTVAIWMFHGVILSGYPLYPQTLIALDVDWRVPKEAADTDAAWIYSWARFPNAPLDFTARIENWIGGWAFVTFFNPHVLVPLALSLIGIIVVRLRRTKKLLPRSLFLITVPFVMGIIYWFLTAPDARFGYILFWGLAFCVLSLTLDFADFRLALLILILALMIVLRTPVVEKLPFMPSWPYVTQSGLRIRVPVLGDRCFDTPLPCTPHSNTSLELRGQSVINGFRLAGER